MHAAVEFPQAWLRKLREGKSWPFTVGVASGFEVLLKEVLLKKQEEGLWTLLRRNTSQLLLRLRSISGARASSDLD